MYNSITNENNGGNMEDVKFSRVYSAKMNSEVESIRNRYVPYTPTKLERLRELDYRVRTAGIIEGLTLGALGALVFGIGMCFGLDVLPGADWITVILCLIGIVSMAPAYTVYKNIATKKRAEMAPEILKLSDELLGEVKNQL